MTLAAQPSTAVAQPNIALIKYWGKRDEAWMLPETGSLSLTLDVFPTRTTVAVDAALTHDVIDFDGALTEGPAVPGTAAGRIAAFLDLVRERAGSRRFARITTQNSVPTGAGLASSASGFAALAVAAADAYGLRLSEAELSRLARRGSGSACRSIIANTAIWHAGDGTGEAADAHSFAEAIDGPALGMVVVVVNDGAKKVSSRDAMRSTRDTSPYYAPWVTATARDLELMREAFAANDYTAIGELTESNALRMHASIEAARPPIRYLAPESVRLFDIAGELRDEGLETYATADAGPNVVLLTRDADVDAVHAAVAAKLGVDALSDPGRIIAARAGLGARLVDAATGEPV